MNNKVFEEFKKLIGEKAYNQFISRIMILKKNHTLKKDS